MYLFAIATLLPVPLFAAGAALGGYWALAALAYITVFAYLLDQFITLVIKGGDEGAEFPAATRLSVLLAVLHFALLGLAIAAVSGMTGLDWGARIALFFGFGLYFGQVSNSNAHELIHRHARGLHRLGMWVYISLLFGHHTSAHRHIHHRFVGTVDDPNTAVLGESFYAYAPRAWWGSFQAGSEIETALRKARRETTGPHPYRIYLGGAVACVLLAGAAFGLRGLIAYLLLAAYAQVQLLLSDYVQHYGLERRRPRGGRVEPVGPAHSWNSAHWFSGAMMLNAPRHSAHHVRPGTPYPALGAPLRGQVPMLPFSLPVMGAIALVPPLWHRMMDKRAERWRGRPPAPPTQQSEAEAPARDDQGPEGPAQARSAGAAPASKPATGPNPAPKAKAQAEPQAPKETKLKASAPAPEAGPVRPPMAGSVAASVAATLAASKPRSTIPYAAPDDDAAIAAAVAMTIALSTGPEDEAGDAGGDLNVSAVAQVH